MAYLPFSQSRTLLALPRNIGLYGRVGIYHTFNPISGLTKPD